jgi:hypothetical protein
MSTQSTIHLKVDKAAPRDTNFIKLVRQSNHIKTITDYSPEELPVIIDTLRAALRDFNELERVYDSARRRKGY